MNDSKFREMAGDIVHQWKGEDWSDDTVADFDELSSKFAAALSRLAAEKDAEYAPLVTAAKDDGLNVLVLNTSIPEEFRNALVRLMNAVASLPAPAEKDAEMTKLNDQWAETRDDLARQNTALRSKLAEKDAQYAGVVAETERKVWTQVRNLAKNFVQTGAQDVESALKASVDWWVFIADEHLASLPSSQVMPGEMTCATDDKKSNPLIPKIIVSEREKALSEARASVWDEAAKDANFYNQPNVATLGISVCQSLRDTFRRKAEKERQALSGREE